MNFREFIADKKLEFMNETHNPMATDAEFADYLTERLQSTPEADNWRLRGHHFSAVSINRWMVGGSLPVEDNLWGIVAIYGDEACSVLGIPRVMPRDPELRRFIDLWLGSSEAKKREVMEFAEQRLSPRQASPQT